MLCRDKFVDNIEKWLSIFHIFVVTLEEIMLFETKEKMSSMIISMTLVIYYNFIFYAY
jgi:hypothetical protein